MTDDILSRAFVANFHDPRTSEESQLITGFAAGDNLYLQLADNDDAWLEGKAVCLGDME
jgi:hypothetical protein